MIIQWKWQIDSRERYDRKNSRRFWMEVCNIVQEAMIKTIPKKKKWKKPKSFSEEALQIAEKRSERQRREGKIYPSECRVPKNSKERWESHHSDHCKETEKNNRMGKTRELFKKIRDTKRTFYAKMGNNKGQNGMELTEAENKARIHRRTL